MGSPYALLPPNERPKDRQPNANIPWYASDVNRLTAPFIMSAVNSQVVHRSSYLQQGYGPHFQYSEQMGMPLSIGG